MNQLNQLVDKIKTLSADSLSQLNDYVTYLQWQEQRTAPGAEPITWTYDFIEHFTEAETLPPNNQQGSEIKLGVAAADGIEKPAIYAHPPVDGRSLIEYYVPIPLDTSQLRLKFAVSIRDGARLTGSNLVAFSIRLNGYRIWGTQTHLRRWQGFEIDLAAQAGDINQITFATEALGNHQWTWAAWGSPTILGTKV